VERHRGCCMPKTTLSSFSRTSIQCKSEINDALSCKRQQKRQLEFCSPICERVGVQMGSNIESVDF